jgi:hypothetical protein
LLKTAIARGLTVGRLAYDTVSDFHNLDALDDIAQAVKDHKSRADEDAVAAVRTED